jgi:NAD(P)-dependent dehydrogenase (short-subunit alcohol dehydrogenase family)
MGPRDRHEPARRLSRLPGSSSAHGGQRHAWEAHHHFVERPQNSGRKGAAHYCASKAGVVMFTKVLAMELGSHRINVNCIAPDLIKFERTLHEVSEEVVRTIVATIPWGRPGSPDDVAHAALFLASPFADFITGEVLTVDGGVATGRTHLPYSSPTRR